MVPTVGDLTMVGPLLTLLVDVHLEEGDVDAAARVAGRLDRIAEAQRGPYLKAAAALAKGRLCVATGEGDARACLHEALEGSTRTPPARCCGRWAPPSGPAPRGSVR